MRDTRDPASLPIQTVWIEPGIQCVVNKDDKRAEVGGGGGFMEHPFDNLFYKLTKMVYGPIECPLCNGMVRVGEECRCEDWRRNEKWDV